MQKKYHTIISTDCIIPLVESNNIAEEKYFLRLGYVTITKADYCKLVEYISDPLEDKCQQIQTILSSYSKLKTKKKTTKTTKKT